MISESYVWLWLPGAEQPVPAGLVRQRGDRLTFHYGRRYLARHGAISINKLELPLTDAWIEPLNDLQAPGCLADAAPDSWGRRVIDKRLGGSEQSLLSYLTQAGSDRIGALDFQASAERYVPRGYLPAKLEDLNEAAHRLLNGQPIPPALSAALDAGSSVGGARPKALFSDGDHALIAKFSAPSDVYPMVRAELLAMRMAGRCGLDAAPVSLRRVAGRDVLLVERFDRVPGTAQRRHMLSALTLLGLPAHAPQYASYAKLSELMLLHFAAPARDRNELFSRIVFNILCGNTDDHARNHAAFWDGRYLSLTPAYDICPYPRGGGEATQAMIIGSSEDRFRFSQVAGAVQRAELYGLDTATAATIAHSQLDTIRASWTEACDEALMTAAERELYRRVFPSEYALQGL
ncbi:MAG: type II toxin-antitoxin system HipA family toxin [Solirubrobacteraceae bacterium]